MRNLSRRLKTIIILILAQTQFLLAYSVRELQEIGSTAASAGSAGIGTQLIFPQEGSFVNPSLLGGFERKGGGLGYVNGPGLNGFWGIFYIPSSLGVLGLSIGYTASSNVVDDLEQYYHIDLSYGRKFTDNFSFGLRLKPSFGSATAGGFFGFAIEPGVIYNTHSEIDFYKGFGLSDFAFYLNVRNLALNFGSGKGSAPRISTHLGFQTDIFQDDTVSTNLQTEFIGIGDFKTVPIHSALSLRYKIAFLRFGYMHSKESTLFKGISLGAGVDYANELGNISLQYGAILPTSERPSTYHFISLTGSYGAIDREAPEVEIETEVKDFSPNFDGVADYLTFDVSVSDDSPITAWHLTVKDKSGNVVRTFENDKRLMEKSFGVGDFFAHFFKSQESLVVPSKIRWDGTSNPVSIEKADIKIEKASKESNVLNDGIYSYEFSVEDSRGNRSAPVIGQMKIDNTPPVVKTASATNLFSPNGDGALDTFEIMHEKKLEQADLIEAKIENTDGVVVRKYEWNGSNIPQSLSWDGTDSENSPAPEGLYNYIISAKDSAGNQTINEIQNISLIRAFDSVDISLSEKGISSNNDNISDTLVIKPSISNKKGLTFWEVAITDEKVDAASDPDNKFPKETIKKWEGDNIDSMPEEFVWQAADNASKPVEDGLYYVTMRAKYQSGNKPVSFSKEIIVDKTPPETQVETEIFTFSPDGDGENEEQIFNIYVKDKIYEPRIEGKSKIKNCALVIYEIGYDNKERKIRMPFKSFQMSGEIPEKIIWDGKSDAGHLVESATVYEYELSSEDIYGNKITSSPGKFETDILVLVTERGLKVRLSNVEFEFGKADLKSKSKGLLDRLAKILGRYPKYRIKVEGHSDDIGEEEYNLKLSEKRAKAVMDYLIEESIESDRISYQGLGEVSPLLPNTSWYNRSRNRRVEFILVKE
ncbi:MAG: OmpA family protein [Spirochaetia bacterium]|nr:OmpA family protein [Spirochaetia bacterium]